mmetsp:Transcript_17619/g.52944  ORF Transcript_17619/g.52944 Transcript_17619/m.52944 type:complete len:287 (+) Transcript_17619:1765-2625(+)
MPTPVQLRVCSTTKCSSLRVSQLLMEEQTVNATSRGHNAMPGGDSQYLNGISMTLLRNSEYASTFIQAGPRLRTNACSTLSGYALVTYRLAACSDSLYLVGSDDRCSASFQVALSSSCTNARMRSHRRTTGLLKSAAVRSKPPRVKGRCCGPSPPRGVPWREDPRLLGRLPAMVLPPPLPPSPRSLAASWPFWSLLALPSRAPPCGAPPGLSQRHMRSLPRLVRLRQHPHCSAPANPQGGGPLLLHNGCKSPCRMDFRMLTEASENRLAVNPVVDSYFKLSDVQGL